MDLLNLITNNTILVIPNNIKNKVLEIVDKSNKLFNIKYMSLNTLIKKYTFDYNDDAIYYLMQKYNFKYSIAKSYIDNLYFIDNKKYNNKKLDRLVNIKNELIQNKLLIIDNNFKQCFKNKNIIIYGYDYINKFQTSILNNIKKNTNIQIIIKNNKLNKKINVYEFDTIEMECDFVALNVIKLIDCGIDINNIKLSNITDEYKFILKNVFDFYKIPIDIFSTSIYENSIVLEYIKCLKETMSFDKSFELIRKKYSFINSENINIYNIIIQVTNKFIMYDLDNNVIECIKENFKSIKSHTNIQENKIEIIDFRNNIIDDNHYVFILGFNEGIIPKTYKDEDYINDNLKESLNIDTTKDKNINEKRSIINIINNINNLIITYKLRTPFDTYLKSSILSDIDCTIIKNPFVENRYNYSNLYNKINLSKNLDKLVKFNIKDSNLDILYNNYKDISYLSYDNSFKGIDKENLIKYLNSNLLLSYSSIDNYYRCNFRYYINNILKINKYVETEATFIGNLFHYVLSQAFNNDFDFDKCINEYIKNKDLNSKMIFFLKKLKRELLFIIDTIKMHNDLSDFKNALYEEKIYINKNRNIKITFMGIVDKILYMQNGNGIYVAIIDYKTGNPNININNTIYGIEMQLPIYLYLVKNNDKFANVEFAGFYLQKILNNEQTLELNDDPIKVKKDSLKLQGYSNSNEEILSKFDKSYENSEMIKGMKLSSKGFYSYSKVLDNNQIELLTKTVDKKIDEAITNILDAKFDINPKKIGYSCIGCEFCDYKDICYMTEKDIVYLKENKDLDFLNVR